MEIVVNDTNILIDLYNAGLLPFCGKLDIEFRTLDVVLEEIRNGNQMDAVRQMIDDGVLKVFSLSGEQMFSVMRKVGQYNGICNLSVVDISVMVYASENNFRLLTGDKVLREKASSENIAVSGILYLTDMMIGSGTVANDAMKAALQRLLQSNNRLPERLIEERLKSL